MTNDDATFDPDATQEIDLEYDTPTHGRDYLENGKIIPVFGPEMLDILTACRVAHHFVRATGDDCDLLLSGVSIRVGFEAMKGQVLTPESIAAKWERAYIKDVQSENEVDFSHRLANAEDVFEAAEIAVGYANATGKNTLMSFKGTHVTVEPNTDTSSVLVNWAHTRKIDLETRPPPSPYKAPEQF